MHAILAEFELPNKFLHEVELEAEKIPDKISSDEIAKRRDFRKVTTFTIDPIDAKDFDDALSYQQLSNGNIEVGIHIADVTFYVLQKQLSMMRHTSEAPRFIWSIRLYRCFPKGFRTIFVHCALTKTNYAILLFLS